ncbi:hypothetical protein Vadar_020262 [Vaccinium darrowii]|uniref:Uncharacterized protein n=1 Tax=Vaccinium darrowii TaxID=229202 RepID=A0ACB7Y9H8_9ERIC|nr:hypothetical protein Vadar_020262 [Vaccinium darrowii]
MYGNDIPNHLTFMGRPNCPTASITTTTSIPSTTTPATTSAAAKMSGAVTGAQSEQSSKLQNYVGYGTEGSMHIASANLLGSPEYLWGRFEESALLDSENSDVRMSLDSFDEGDENDFDAVVAEMEKEMSVAANVMKELGYGCTVNVSQYTQMLSLFLPLVEMTVSTILGTIARTHAALEENQNSFSSFFSALSTSSSFKFRFLFRFFHFCNPETL